MADVPNWFAGLMVVLAECYPAARLREGMVRAYYAVLNQYPEPDVRGVFARAPLEYRTYFPSAGELLSLLDPAPDDKGLLAWNGLNQSAGTVGIYQPLECEQAVAAALLLVFGSWAAFCEQAVDGPSGPWSAKRTEFLAAYRTARRTAQAGPCVPELVRLPGLLGHGAEGTWVGRLTAGGAESVRGPQQLTAADVTRLTGGTDGRDEV